MSVKRSWNDALKEKVAEVLTVDFMSSEEDKEDHFEVRPLQWRSAQCDTYFEQLDTKIEQTSSKKAKRQTIKRKVGPWSGRGAPNELKVSQAWAVRKDI